MVAGSGVREPRQGPRAVDRESRATGKAERVTASLGGAQGAEMVTGGSGIAESSRSRVTASLGGARGAEMVTSEAR